MRASARAAVRRALAERVPANGDAPVVRFTRHADDDERWVVWSTDRRGRRDARLGHVRRFLPSGRRWYVDADWRWLAFCEGCRTPIPSPFGIGFPTRRTAAERLAVHRRLCEGEAS